MIVVWLVAALVASFTVVALAIERFAPRSVLKAYWRVTNPFFRVLAGRMPGWVLLETTGRRSGRTLHVPVGGQMDGSVVWIVAGHATRSGYVHNIRANARVRVRVRGRWRSGKASLVPEDDPARRANRNPLNGFFLRASTSDLLTVRVDLD